MGTKFESHCKELDSTQTTQFRKEKEQALTDGFSVAIFYPDYEP